MFLQGKFPKSALNHCLHVAANFEHQYQLRRIIVDVDDRHIEVANKLFVDVCTQQAYALTHRLARGRNVDAAEAGSADYQGWLAAEILTQSAQEDRCVEALKWLILAHIIRSKAGQTEALYHRSAFEFLAAGMSGEQKDCAWALADKWFLQKLVDQIDYAEFVPEFRAFIASLEESGKVV
jgi:hypothetical protein